MTSESGVRPSHFQEVAARFTGLELFFDLVFAFCVSQLTRVYRDDPTWPTAVTALLIFVPVWWAWIGVSFALDRFPADDIISRFLVIGTAAGTSVMGLASRSFLVTARFPSSSGTQRSGC